MGGGHNKNLLSLGLLAAAAAATMFTGGAAAPALAAAEGATEAGAAGATGLLGGAEGLAGAMLPGGASAIGAGIPGAELAGGLGAGAADEAIGSLAGGTAGSNASIGVGNALNGGGLLGKAGKAASAYQKASGLSNAIAGGSQPSPQIQAQAQRPPAPQGPTQTNMQILNPGVQQPPPGVSPNDPRWLEYLRKQQQGVM